MGSLEGRVCLVTGASAGIGAAVVRDFLAEGGRVLATARRADRLEPMGAPAPERYAYVAGDIAVPEFQASLMHRARERFGPVDVLINNAGFGQRGPVELVDEARARRQLEVNVHAPMALARLVLPAMRERGRGRIINVSSVAGRVALPNSGWYAASKFALEALSDALRLEVSAFGIDVVLIEPGPVLTEFGQVAGESLEAAEWNAGPYARMIHQMTRARGAVDSGAATAEACARLIRLAATVDRPRARYVITPLAHAMIALRWLLPDALLDALIRWRAGVPGRGELRPDPVDGPGPR